MLLAIYGDSLSLPRRVVGVRAVDTFAEGVARRLGGARLYNRSRAGRPIAEMAALLKEDLWYFGEESPSALVIQLGIVDCAPRPLSSTWKARVDRMPRLVRSVVKRAVRASRPFIVEKNLFVRETEPEAFQSGIREMIEDAAAHVDRIVVVNICPNHPAILARSPRMPESIQLYNGLIDSALLDAGCPKATLANVFEAVSAVGVDGHVTPEDGHHITPAGHRIYEETIMNALERLGAPSGKDMA